MKFLEQGYNFFALDLRKCGRSIISPGQEQYRHYFTDIHEYDEEVTLSIEHIIKKANGKPRKLILYGHSTGNKHNNQQDDNFSSMNRRSCCLCICILGCKTSTCRCDRFEQSFSRYIGYILVPNSFRRCADEVWFIFRCT